MLCVLPALSDRISIEYVAVPRLFTGMVASMAGPSLKVMVPVAAVPSELVNEAFMPLTVAANIAFLPNGNAPPFGKGVALALPALLTTVYAKVICTWLSSGVTVRLTGCDSLGP